MSGDRWRRLQMIFEEALEHTLEERALFVTGACGGDIGLQGEVEQLLAHDVKAQSEFLHPPDRDLVAERIGEPSGADAIIGCTIGNYHIKGIIGSGGMGTVYLAEQAHPRREVALKIMRTSIASRSAVKRFEYESQILAHLRHPNIAQVFAAGMHDEDSVQVPYFAMEYIPDARTIIEYAAEKKLSIRKQLELFAQVCEAVHHGHQKGIIHRDLKPGNILVDSSCHVKIIDFGVARTTDSDIAMTTMQTDVGQMIGTLQYMSPEQCDADQNVIDTRSDVYAMGVVLYELLTGELPYKASSGTIYQATQIIKEAAPRRLSSINAKLRGDVETIVLKTLEKDRDRRYQSATGLTADINRYLRGEPISARPPSAVYVACRFIQRHTWKVAAMVGGFLALIALVTVGFVWNYANAAKEAERISKVLGFGAKLGAAEAALRMNDAATARKLLEQTKQNKPTWEWQHLSGRVDQSLRTLTQDNYSTYLNSFLDSSGVLLALSSLDGTPIVTRIHDIQSGSVLCTLPKDGKLRIPVAFSANGNLLATVAKARDSDSTRQLLQLWRVDLSCEPELIANWLPHDDGVEVAALLHGKSRMILATGSAGSGEIKLWDLSNLPKRSAPGNSPHPIATLPNHTRGITSLAFSPDGNCLASCSFDFTARLWDVEAALAGEENCELAVLAGHTDHVLSAVFSPDGKRLATASVDKTICLWDVEASIKRADEARRTGQTAHISGVRLSILTGHKGAVMSVAFDASGRRLVSGGGDRTLRVWDVDENAVVSDAHHRDTWSAPRRHLINTLRGHGDEIRDVAFLPDGRIISAADDGTTRIWAADVEDVWRLREHYSSVNAVAFTPDGKYAISAGGDTCFIVWDTRLCVPVARRILRVGEVIRDLACWNDNGHLFLAIVTALQVCVKQGEAYANFDGRVLLWNLDDPANPRLIARLRADDDFKHGYLSLVVSQNGRRLAAGDHASRVFIWEIDSSWNPADIPPLGTPGSDSRSDESNTGLMIDRHPAFVLGGSHTEQINGLIFLDKEGNWLVTGCGDLVSGSQEHTIQLWDVNSGREVSKYSDHEGAIAALALSPDRRTLASASCDETIRLWSVDWSGSEPSMEPGYVLRGHTDWVRGVAFHPDENRLASGSQDRTIKLWDYATGVEVATLRGQKGFVYDLAFDSSGQRLISASNGFQGSDNVARLWEKWDGGIPPDLLYERTVLHRARDEVWRLLRTEGVTLKEARQRIENSGDRLPEDVRKAALERWDDLSADWYWFRMRAWDSAAQPGLSHNAYSEALGWAETALKNAPENDLCIMTASMLHYRLGAADHNQQGISDGDRLKSMNDALKLIDPATAIEGTCQPGAWALTALAHQAIGRAKQSEQAFQQMEKLMHRDVSWRQEALILVEEARQQLLSEPDTETPPPKGSNTP